METISSLAESRWCHHDLGGVQRLRRRRAARPFSIGRQHATPQIGGPDWAATGPEIRARAGPYDGRRKPAQLCQAASTIRGSDLEGWAGPPQDFAEGRFEPVLARIREYASRFRSIAACRDNEVVNARCRKVEYVLWLDAGRPVMAKMQRLHDRSNRRDDGQHFIEA